MGIHYNAFAADPNASKRTLIDKKALKRP